MRGFLMLAATGEDPRSRMKTSAKQPAHLPPTGRQNVLRRALPSDRASGAGQTQPAAAPRCGSDAAACVVAGCRAAPLRFGALRGPTGRLDWAGLGSIPPGDWYVSRVYLRSSFRVFVPILLGPARLHIGLSATARVHRWKSTIISFHLHEHI